MKFTKIYFGLRSESFYASLSDFLPASCKHIEHLRNVWSSYECVKRLVRGYDLNVHARQVSADADRPVCGTLYLPLPLPLRVFVSMAVDSGECLGDATSYILPGRYV